MKKLIVLFCICLVLFNCNNDDDQKDPIVEKEPDLSFPDCLLSENIFEYMLIIDNEPTEPRGELIKMEYQGEYFYTFNQYNMTDVPVTFLY